VPFRAALRRATNESFVLYLISAFFCALRAFFRNRLDTSLEVLALRQQIVVLKRQRPRPPLTRFDRFFWTSLKQVWPRWSELLKLGFEISERTVARYLRRLRRRRDPNAGLRFSPIIVRRLLPWIFFAVPIVTFKLLYCFFVIEHGRCRILHFNVTSRPSSEWVVQQLREAFPESARYRM
jgi:hypothetical protein